MAHVDSINIHHADRLVAKPMYSEGTAWVSLEFAEDGSHRQFRVSVFMDYDRASRLAGAINEAWPVPEADPVITWPRPSYHRPAVGMRAADILPDDPLPAWGTLVREMNGDDGENAA